MVPAPVARVSAAAAAAERRARGQKVLCGEHIFTMIMKIPGKLELMELEFPWKEVAPIRPDGYSIRSVDSKA